MTDFVRPYGKHVGMRPEMKKAFFTDVAATMNRNKLYSLSVSLIEYKFSNALSAEVQRNLIGPDGMALFTMVICNQYLAKLNHHENKTAFLVDHGAAHPEQLLAAQKIVQDIELQSGDIKYVGAIEFDKDDNDCALQAADRSGVVSKTRRTRFIDR